MGTLTRRKAYEGIAKLKAKQQQQNGTAKANAPLQREVLHNMQAAIKEVSKIDIADL
jgi:hypothetical protein